MCKSKERGSALITVILVVLVLTMVGIASLFFMTTEERISSVARLEKAAFYAAEVGLRRGEISIRDQYNSRRTVLTDFLTLPDVQNEYNVLQVPSSGGSNHTTAVVLRDVLGLDPEVQVQREDPAIKLIDPDNAVVPIGEMRGFQVDNQGYISTYNLYIRNDDDDTSDTVDSNDRISLISVGLVVTPSGQVVRKIIEEGIAPVGAGSLKFNLQKLANKMGSGG